MSAGVSVGSWSQRNRNFPDLADRRFLPPDQLEIRIPDAPVGPIWGDQTAQVPMHLALSDAVFRDWGERGMFGPNQYLLVQWMVVARNEAGVGEWPAIISPATRERLLSFADVLPLIERA